MSTFTSFVVTKLKKLAITILVGYGITISAYVSLVAYEIVKEDIAFRKLQNESFQDYVIYYSVLPSTSINIGGNYFVEHGSVARAQSNFIIIKIPNKMLKLSWEEIIECDLRPLDGHIKYNPFAMVYSAPKPRIYTKIKEVKSIPGGEGYVIKDALTGKGIHYPEEDANCRTEITVTQHHIRGEVKVLTFYSEIAYVRDLSKIIDNG